MKSYQQNNYTNCTCLGILIRVGKPTSRNKIMLTPNCTRSLNFSLWPKHTNEKDATYCKSGNFHDRFIFV